MYKKVNIIPQGPIYSLKVPVTAPMMGVQMSVGDIARCIHARALVTEILPNGEEVKLSLSNYNKDNYVKTEVKVEPTRIDVKEVPTVEPVIAAPIAVEHIIQEPTIEPVVQEPVIVESVQPEEVKEEVEEVKSMDRDPKYFKEVQNQKNKIKK